MEKYYFHNYDRRMGGDYCEIYDADLKMVRTVKGASEIDGLQEITKRKSTVAALQKTEPLNNEFSLVVGRHELSREQIDNVNRNLEIK